MKILIVGAGAVGQVYGYHLQRSGAEVSFLVKPKYVESARGGFVLYPLRSKKRLDSVKFEAAKILSEMDEVAAHRWDQVWLCVPTDAAEDRDWMSGLVAAIGNAPVVSMMPGMHVRELLLEFVPEERLATGVIGMISYQLPLPGGADVDEPGVAYMFPPANKTMLSGAPAELVARMLNEGKCPAKATPKAFYILAMGSAMLMCNMVGLEAAGWSLRAYRSGQWVGLAARAAREAQRVVGARLGERPPWWHVLLRGFLLRVVWTVAPWAVPFDLEVYLEYHFTKVRSQTKLLIEGYLREARERAMQVPSLEQLHQAVFAPERGTT